MEVDFISAFENARTNAPSCRITRETIEVLTLFSQRCIMYQSNRSFNILPPPGIPRAFDVLSCPGGREFD